MYTFAASCTKKNNKIKNLFVIFGRERKRAQKREKNFNVIVKIPTTGGDDDDVGDVYMRAHVFTMNTKLTSY